MSNAAYTDRYKQRWNECQPLFIPDNLYQSESRHLSDLYSVHVNEYAGEVGTWNLCGSECNLIDVNGKNIAGWRSIDNNADFYSIIRHSNSREYLIFRQDLYGYSVLDIKTSQIMQFFPKSSLDGGETFIWTDVKYNPVSNILAVYGCYWACPYNIHLFSFGNPMSDTQKYVDLLECFEGGYDIYDDVNFVKWDGSDLHITRYVIETKTKESVIITQDQYLAWLSKKDREYHG